MTLDQVEEIHIAKVLENSTPKVVPAIPGSYAVFHVVNGWSSNWIGINYDNLTGYMSGALHGKRKSNVALNSGISERARDGWFPGVKFEKLSGVELEKLLTDARVDRHYSVNDFG